jgi:ribosome-associated protein
LRAPKGNRRYFHLPQHEVKVSFARSSGPGGQNVNKTATKAVVRWKPSVSNALSSEQKIIITKKLGNKLTENGDIVMADQTTRSQLANRTAAVGKLEKLIKKALYQQPVRRSTRPTRGSVERRLQGKKRASALKKLRNFFE